MRLESGGEAERSPNYDLQLVNVGSIPTGPTHAEGRLQPHPGEVLQSTPNVRKSTRRLVSQGSDDGHALAGANSEGDLAASENSVINIF